MDGCGRGAGRAGRYGDGRSTAAGDAEMIASPGKAEDYGNAALVYVLDQADVYMPAGGRASSAGCQVIEVLTDAGAGTIRGGGDTLHPPMPRHGYGVTREEAYAEGTPAESRLAVRTGVQGDSVNPYRIM